MSIVVRRMKKGISCRVVLLTHLLTYSVQLRSIQVPVVLYLFSVYTFRRRYLYLPTRGTYLTVDTLHTDPSAIRSYLSIYIPLSTYCSN